MVVNEIESELGPIYALVNIIRWVGTTRFMKEDSTYWQKIIAINLESILYVTYPVLDKMIERQSGTVVNFSSDAGRIGTSFEVVYPPVA